MKPIVHLSALTALFILLPSLGKGFDETADENEGIEILDTSDVLEIDQIVVDEPDGVEDATQTIDDILIMDAATPEETGEILMDEESDIENETLYIDNASIQEAVETQPDRSGFSVGVDEGWIEVGYLPRSGSEADSSSYLHSVFNVRWELSPAWELQLEGRIDGYYQSGGRHSDRTRLDYGESFIRYRGENIRLTAGTQSIVWGRIDELPPTDRLSVVDLSRFILDDLPDRRRAAPALRLEYFSGAHKLDLVFLPWFREAQLPEHDSIWYPVDRQKGEVLGIESTPSLRALIQATDFATPSPDGDGGFGLRYSHTASNYDYALTVQRARQSIPYYEFSLNRFVATYPRSWVIGGDFGFEAKGATWRFEAAWISDTPVTKTDMTTETVKSISWAAGTQFYPADGDTRINLQLIGGRLLSAPQVIEREESYMFTAGVETPFARNRWRFESRLFFGLDKKDIYINPEVAYLGWEPHEIYLAAHYFGGANGTLGGFHEDHSMLTLGWRAKF